MNIGDYVRTKNGYIGQIYNINDCREPNMMYCLDMHWKDFIFIGKDDFKSSPNIIDLIEVGDYVNGCYVKEIFINDDEKLLFVDCDSEQLSVIGDGLITICEVLTREQYENNCYRVERK